MNMQYLGNVVARPQRIRPLILCGGSGARLWPLSRDSMPKQFAPLLGEKSTFQETVLRVRQPGFGPPVISTNHAHLVFVERQLAEIGVAADIVVEPARRDSGPAILAGCLKIAQLDPGALVLVMASDHFVREPASFLRAVKCGAPAAESGHFVTFGVTPISPETGYGYIEPGEQICEGVSGVLRFAEKPSETAAKEYVARGLLWNSGNFLFSATALLEEYRRFDPVTAAVVEAARDAAREKGDVQYLGDGYSDARATSIDYAVMEKTSKAAVVPVSCGWSDIGSWDAMWQIGSRDGAGNVATGAVEVLNSENCLIRSDGPIVSVVGLKDLVVVAADDAVLVVERQRSGDVKGLVERMRKKGLPQADTHSKVHRPWGWYRVLDAGSGFQVKRIVVRPGGRLSLQKHRFRAEHWVVVSGKATVTVDRDVKTRGPNEHVNIPLGAVHRLENFGGDPVEIIEVQSGSYLGEDDIIRLEDVYHRV